MWLNAGISRGVADRRIDSSVDDRLVVVTISILISRKELRSRTIRVGNLWRFVDWVVRVVLTTIPSIRRLLTGITVGRLRHREGAAQTRECGNTKEKKQTRQRETTK